VIILWNTVYRAESLTKFYTIYSEYKKVLNKSKYYEIKMHMNPAWLSAPSLVPQHDAGFPSWTSASQSWQLTGYEDVLL